VSESVEQAAPPIDSLDSAWKMLLEMANGSLTTNDPWIAAALTVICFEMAARR